MRESLPRHGAVFLNTAFISYREISSLLDAVRRSGTSLRRKGPRQGGRYPIPRTPIDIPVIA